MLRSYLLVRDHLEQAQAILQVDEPDARQLQKTLQVLINFIDKNQYPVEDRRGNVVSFPTGGRHTHDDQV